MGAALRMARLYYDRYQDVQILDWANSEGKTALHIAATKGNEELVRVCTVQYVHLHYRAHSSVRCCVIWAPILTCPTMKGILHYTSKV